jgi:hypothetical protein
MFALQKILPSRFIQFRSPVDNSPVFVQTVGPDDKAVTDTSKPVGIKIYGPGSKEARNADAIATQEMIDAKLKKGNAAMTQRLGLEKLARLSIEFVNFDYNGKTSGFEMFKDFYNDEGWDYLKVQIEDGMAEVADFCRKPDRADAPRCAPGVAARYARKKQALAH